VLRHMFFVTCACRYSIGMAILANNRDNVAVEDLTSTLFALMLTGTPIYLVDVPNGTSHAPSAVQTSSRLSWKSRDNNNCPRDPRCSH
jgi:hypothetical protein